MKKVKKQKNLFLRNGVWFFRKRMTINGKLVYVKKSTGFSVDALPEALTRAAEIEIEARKIAHGWQHDVKAEAKKRALAFAEWAERYQKTYSATKQHPERDRHMLAHALPFFGSKRMDTVTVEDCKAYLLLRAEQGAEAWTVRRDRGFLCAMWNAAIENRKTTNVVENPWKGVKPPTCHARTRTVSYADEQAMMTKGTPTPEYQRALTVLLGTGLRANEFLELRLRDMKNGELHIRWQTSKGQKERFVPLIPEVEQAIREQAEAGTRTPFQRLWSMTDWALLKRVKRIAERAEIEDHAELRVHDLRRTFGTRCARAGMPLPQLSKIMGHSSTAITSQYYVHVDRRDNAAALAAIAQQVLAVDPQRVPAKSATA